MGYKISSPTPNFDRFIGFIRVQMLSLMVTEMKLSDFIAIDPHK